MAESKPRAKSSTPKPTTKVPAKVVGSEAKELRDAAAGARFKAAVLAVYNGSSAERIGEILAG